MDTQQSDSWVGRRNRFEITSRTSVASADHMMGRCSNRSTGQVRNMVSRQSPLACDDQASAIPTIGLFRVLPPVEPKNCELPKQKTPPSEATNR